MNKYWVVLLLGIVAVVVWFGIHACYEVYVYQQLKEKTPIHHADWSITKLGRDRYGFQASYTFLRDGILQKGSNIFVKGPIFRNRWAAEQALSDYAGLYQTVWYSQRHSSLQKSFPLKECIYAGLLCAILIYLIWLRYYSLRLSK